MTAKAEVAQGHSGCLVILLIAAAVGLVALIAVPQVCQHAIDRHGGDAFSAVRYVQEYTPTPDGERYWVGTDDIGRQHHVLKLPKLPGKETVWAVVVIGGGGAFMVTAFLCGSKRSVDRIKDRCDDPYWKR